MAHQSRFVYFGFLNVGSPAKAEVCISLKDRSCYGTSGNPNVVANAIGSGEEVVFDLTLDNLNGDGSQAFATVAAYEDAFSNGNPVFFRFKPLEGVLSDPGSVKFGAKIPEPGSLALLGIGLVGLGAIRRRRKAA